MKGGLYVMKRKVITTAGIVLALVLSVTIQPVRAAVFDALSVFRVNEIHTIKIELADIEEFLQNSSSLGSIELPEEMPVSMISNEGGITRELNGAEDFEAFDFRLPGKLKDQTPIIKGSDAGKAVVSLDVITANRFLTALGGYALPESLAGAEFTIEIPPSVAVKYDNVLLAATQLPVVESDRLNAVQIVRDAIIALPVIPSGVRNQLLAIPVNDPNVYLPVLVGVGRSADIKGNTGYIYTLSDLQAYTNALPSDMLTGMLPEQNANSSNEASSIGIIGGSDGPTSVFIADSEVPEGMDFEDASVLIWTRDGVIYALAGAMTDAELIEIARSI